MHGLTTAWIEVEISNHCTLLMVLHEGVLNKYINSDYSLNLLKPKTYFMYEQFLHSEILCLPTQCIYVFCMDLRTNNNYFPLQH